ncbi:hypothetical protein H920_18037 [Fukomys damarensis]|uniref:Uncharacterized protein n=1 Tax=Fukomys damarensis TaxID=885580 RepID=A0A091CQX1_FUKDA|nr:hypothetical protein H920_18037 [Fukomys damarensis]
MGRVPSQSRAAALVVRCVHGGGGQTWFATEHPAPPTCNLLGGDEKVDLLVPERQSAHARSPTHSGARCRPEMRVGRASTYRLPTWRGSAHLPGAADAGRLGLCRSTTCNPGPGSELVHSSFPCRQQKASRSASRLRELRDAKGTPRPAQRHAGGPEEP